MSRFRRGARPLACLACASALAMVAACGESDSPSASAATSDEAQLLYVQRAERGTLTTIDAGAGTYRLTLRGAEPSVEWFTDRPEHRAGRFGVASMLRTFGWRASGDALGDDPPNLVLNADGGGDPGTAPQLVAELLSARWDGARRVAAYELRRNPGSAAPSGEIALDHPSLFIDSAAVVAPMTFEDVLTRDASGEYTIVTVVEGFPDAGARVSFMGDGVEGASFSLTPQAPTATGASFTVGSFTVRVNSLRLQPATADTPGRVHADLVLTDQNGRGSPVPFDSVVAQWPGAPRAGPRGGAPMPPLNSVVAQWPAPAATSP